MKNAKVFSFFFGFPVEVFFVSFIFWFFVRVAHIRDRGNEAAGVGGKGHTAAEQV